MESLPVETDDTANLHLSPTPCYIFHYRLPGKFCQAIIKNCGEFSLHCCSLCSQQHSQNSFQIACGNNTSYKISSLADLCSCRHFFLRNHEGEISISIFCTEDHSFTEDSCKFSRFQVSHYHYSLANHFLCTVMCFNS